MPKFFKLGNGKSIFLTQNNNNRETEDIKMGKELGKVNMKDPRKMKIEVEKTKAVSYRDSNPSNWIRVQCRIHETSLFIFKYSYLLLSTNLQYQLYSLFRVSFFSRKSRLVQVFVSPSLETRTKIHDQTNIQRKRTLFICKKSFHHPKSTNILVHQKNKKNERDGSMNTIQRHE